MLALIVNGITLILAAVVVRMALARMREQEEMRTILAELKESQDHFKNQLDEIEALLRSVEKSSTEEGDVDDPEVDEANPIAGAWSEWECLSSNFAHALSDPAVRIALLDELKIVKSNLYETLETFSDTYALLTGSGKSALLLALKSQNAVVAEALKYGLATKDEVFDLSSWEGPKRFDFHRRRAEDRWDEEGLLSRACNT